MGTSGSFKITRALASYIFLGADTEKVFFWHFSQLLEVAHGSVGLAPKAHSDTVSYQGRYMDQLKTNIRNKLDIRI